MALTPALTRIRNNQVYNSDIYASAKLVAKSVTGGLLSDNFTYTGNMFIGNLTVNGQTTTIDTTNLVVADPLLAINRNQSGVPSYDLGFVMGRGSSTNVAMIWEETNQQFQLQYTTESTSATTFGVINNSGYANLQAYGIKLNNATIGSASITTLNTAGVLTASGNIWAASGTASTTTNTGALVVTGGTGISGALNVGTGLNLLGNGYITTDQATATLFNITPTTINFGGAATSFNLGATTGTLTLNNPTVVGSQTTQSLFNTVATTLNIGGAATIVSIGASNGRTNINNDATADNFILNSSAGQFIGNVQGAIGANVPNSGVFTTVVVGTQLDATTIKASTIGNAGANFTGATLNTSSIITAQGTVSAPTVQAGTIGNAGAVHSGASMTLTGNASVNAISAGQIGNVGTVLEGVIGSATPSQPNITSVGTLTSLTTTGTVSAPTINAGTIGNSGTTFTGASSTLTGNLSLNAVSAGQIGNIGTILEGTIAKESASQPNITSLGTLTSLTTSGTIAAQTINAGVIGNAGSQIYGANIAITGNALIQNGLALNSNATITTDQATVTLFNLSSTTINMGGAATAINLGKNDGTSAVKVNGTANSYGSGQGALQIAGGFYAGGDSYIAGNLVVGNLSSLGYTAVIANSPLLYLEAPSISTYNYEAGFYSHKYDAFEGYNHFGLVRNHIDNAWYLFSNIRTEPGLTVDLANVNIVYDTVKLGNIIAYSGNTSTSTTTGAAVIYGGMGVNGNIYAYAIQNTPIGNGTASTGAFTTLTTSGTITAQGTVSAPTVNAGTIGNIGATIIGASASFNNISAGLIGNSGALLQGTLVAASASQPNITSLGTLTSLTVSGTISASTVNAGTIGNSGATFTGASMTLTGNVSVNAVSAGQIGNTNTILEGTIGSATPSQPNITSLGTLTSLTVTGNATVGNLNSVGQVVGYHTGAIGANAPNSGVFTSIITTTTGGNGNVIVAGSINVTGNINNILSNVYSQGGIFYGAAGTGSNALYAGTTNYTPLPNTIVQMTANINNYAQVNFQNANSGAYATTDYIATAGNGTDTTYYIDMGISGSGYNNTSPNNSLGTSLQPNDAYLYSQGNLGTTVGGNLVIGAVTPNKNINFIVGGVNSSDITLTLSSTNVHVLRTTTATSTTSGALVVDGGVGVAGSIYSGANIYATTAMSSPSAYRNNMYPYSGSDINYNTGVNGNLNINPLGVVANLVVYGNTAAGYQNLLTTNGASGQVGIKIAPSAITTGATFQVNSADSMIIPSGSTANRPSGVAGMIRYNTNTNQLEFYNTGTSAWTGTGSTFTVVTSDQFTGDGTTTNFTLSQSTSTTGTIVAINGVIQIPTTAYSVSGTTLTFTEAPLSTDIIDARSIVTTAQVTSITDATGANAFIANSTGSYTTVSNVIRHVANSGTSGSNYFSGGQAPLMSNVALTQNTPTNIDSFSVSAFRGAKYVIKITDGTNNRYSMAEVIVVHDGTTPTSQIYGVVNTGANTLANFSTTISGGLVNLQANTWSSTASATMFPTYMPL